MASIMVNDFAGERRRTQFDTFDRDRIVALADELRAAGIDVTLTTWVMPHAGFIAGLGDTMRELSYGTGATRIILDAEEPWMQAVAPLGYADAAGRIRDALAGIDLGLTAIVYCDVEKTAPLAKICGTWMPQAYVTLAGGSPTALVRTAYTRWTTKFGSPSDGFVMGLAAYNQPRPASELMQPCLYACADVGIDAVCYWAHGSILDRDDVAAVTLAASKAVASPEPSVGIMPEIDVVTMPSGVYSLEVARIQGLLAAAATKTGDAGPGPIDGKPGPKTVTALESFQACQGLPITGVCDGGTWYRLLSFWE